MSRLALEADTGLTVCHVPSVRSTVVHRLVCSQLADGQRGYWIDARNTASTHVLYDCAASPRALEGLQIARAFTAYQHHSLVRRVARVADSETALLVAPNVVDRYRDDDLREYEREELLAATLTILGELGHALDCPVLVTAADEDAGAAVSEYADHEIECLETREGIRLEGEGVQTDGYWHGSYWQTTIPYWVEVCGALDRGIDPVVRAYDRGLVESTADGEAETEVIV
ncbi:hypothetical protein OB955_07920 [Halobacteria archaeon AArc-m2/3/4]|uniref:Uncharacterized protein n=1 Tax=Natronoglomus mannanivorans TaxID=2979990 RepID=A0ABT2QCN4_9EURY|nr:hypothetical protein [Halobacteria archaeon AArc-m2/3/4]